MAITKELGQRLKQLGFAPEQFPPNVHVFLPRIANNLFPEGVIRVHLQAIVDSEREFESLALSVNERRAIETNNEVVLRFLTGLVREFPEEMLEINPKSFFKKSE